jgi:hypothetical protein
MNLYISCPLHFLAPCVNSLSKSQNQRRTQHDIKIATTGNSRYNVSQSTAPISPTPTNKTTKSHAHPTKITTPPPPIRTPQPNLRPRPPAAPPNRPLRLANNGSKRKNNNNPASQPPHTHHLHRPPTHMSPNPRRDQLATVRTKRLHHPSYACHAPRCLPGAANVRADRRHGGSAMEAGFGCHGGSCAVCS